MSEKIKVTTNIEEYIHKLAKVQAAIKELNRFELKIDTEIVVKDIPKTINVDIKQSCNVLHHAFGLDGVCMFCGMKDE